ncbi:DUF6052 family protein [Streptomyces sp. NPDC057638]|uniref:DUF6052 family protein n=1 Tax=Streptomyces sp. NPDC057638 TaxID=3346190 RepID=UPI00369C1F96
MTNAISLTSERRAPDVPVTGQAAGQPVSERPVAGQPVAGRPAGPQVLTPAQEETLLAGYRALTAVERSCAVPAVRAALRGALAELRVALEGQAVELDDYYRTA